jgi:release factor glutamine methyltransferase
MKNEKYYGPEEDTYMLISVLKKYLQEKKIRRSLEIGVGNGEVSKLISDNSRYHIGTDINPHALKHTKNICDSGKYIKSNLFEKVKGKYDLVVFNPPYLPAVKGEEDDWKIWV